jgi:phospholipase C
MAYPVTASQTINVNQSMSVSFQPLAAGLITVIVTGSELVGPAPRPIDGEPPNPTILSVRLDVYAPGATTPALSQTGARGVTPANPDYIVLSGDVPAAANQLGGDWTATVTNISTLSGTFNVTVRYPVVAGNLGKVDHIIVVMMENRSFDHMLGYLKLTGANTDVDGLTGNEFNRDPNGVVQKVSLLPTTQFINDPGHGWTDVAGPLPAAPAGSVTASQLHRDVALPPGPPTRPPPGSVGPWQLNGDPGAGLSSNAGFIVDFAHQLASETSQAPHDQSDIAAGGSITIAFRPNQTGTIGVRSVPTTIPNQSTSGLLGQIAIFTPGATVAVATQSAPIGIGAMSIDYTVTSNDLGAAGEWTCQVTNRSDSGITVVTDISNVSATAAPGGEEPLPAIMGYYNKLQLPTYDFLASQYVICDRWFAAIPTDTFPNRLYAMSGTSAGLLTTPSDSSFVTSGPPAYTQTTIFEVLQQYNIDWNIYFSNLPFALVFKNLCQNAQFTTRMLQVDALVELAKTGNLPSMAWVDPKFNDVPHVPETANDDHPPGDVSLGQAFIASVYNALATSPSWSKTLLIVTYDEHGGFYDHVEPPGTPPRTDGPNDDDPNLRRYGLRVPAFVISPWVPQGEVAHTIFDHTSILRTLLLRFCETPIGAAQGPNVTAAPHGIGVPPGITAPPSVNVPSMGARVDSANDLGPLLSLDSPRTATQIPTGAIPAISAPTFSSPLTGIGTTIRRAIIGF